MDKSARYTYKIPKPDGSFKPGYTTGEFSFWARSHLSDEREAIFRLPNSVKVILHDILTDETLARLPPMPRNIPDYPGFDQENHGYFIAAKQDRFFIAREPLMRAIFRYLDVSSSADIIENRKAILNAEWSEWITHLGVRDEGSREVAKFNFDTWEWEINQ